MSSRVGVRPRRTRVYDCNYNIGESYYKPTIDRMDGKAPARPEPVEERLPRGSRLLDEFEAPRSRNEQSPTNDTLFDSRGARTARGRPLRSALDDEEFDDEVTSSLRRLRANKKSSTFAEDLELDSTFSSLDNRSRLGMSEKIMESVGIGSSEISSARRALEEDRSEKRRSRRLSEDEGGLMRWSAIPSAEKEVSAAAQRARASRARLSDLDDEMTEINARQQAREKRAANLRRLVAENEENSISSSNISVRTEKKQVSF